MVPPVLPEAAGTLAPADAGGVLAPPPVLAAAVALGLDEALLHAAMTMPIAPVESPRIVAPWMNSRRLSRPAEYAYTTSSCRAAAERRTLSNLR